MSRHKRIVLWVTGILGSFLVLLLIFILLLPTLINLELMRKKILAAISREVGGKAECQRLDLSFFPRPLLTVHQGSLSIPERITGTVESLKIYPEILPLLTGKVRMTMLHVEAPDFKMNLPERPEKKKERPKPFSFATIEGKVAPFLALMALKAPGLVVRVERGRLNLFEENRPVFWFRDIDTRIGLPPNKLKIGLTCESNLWESISLRGLLNSKDFKSNGRIDLTHFQPQALTGYLFPRTPLRVVDSKVNLSLSFTTDGLKVLHAEVRGSLPYLTLQRAKQKLVIRGMSLKGAFRMDEDRITVSLAELYLNYPQLTMSGKLFMDQNSPRASLEFEGREVGICSTREVVLGLAAGIPVVQKVFNILRGGKVPIITVNTQGRLLADLGKAENILIKGSMLEGKIFVPKARFQLKDVKGEVVISKGILEGKHLEAQIGNMRGREGILRLGLSGKGTPFHLDTVIQADLAQLPPFLKSLVKNEILGKEMALINDIKGNALGRLVLGESRGSINVSVDVWNFNLYTHYQRIPYPLEIKGGKFSYDGTKIVLRDLSGTVGKSSFSRLSTRLDWEKECYLEVTFEASRIFLEEIYPWLLSFEKLTDALRNAKSVRGTVALDAFDLKGPLLKPREWRFRMTGELENLAVDSTLFPGPVEVTMGKFEAIPQKLSLMDFQTSILDASLRVSGILHGYLQGLHKADFTLQGNMGSEAAQWVSNSIRLPPELRVRTPLSISKAHLIWDKNAKTFFSGNLAVKDGPKVSIDILLNSEELVINNLLIQDEESHAALTLDLKKKEFDFKFSGNLVKKTLDGLLAKNQFIAGWIKGDFRAHILIDQPMKSTAQGKLQGVGLGSLWKLKAPVKIERVSLVAAKNKLKIESALWMWEENPLTLKGNVDFSAKGFLLDMDVSVDDLEWSKVKKILAKEKKERDLEQGKNVRTLPLQGILRVKSKYFTYGGFTWSPFHADISFSHDRLSVSVTEATLCGISTPAILKVSPQGLLLDVKPVSKNQELNPTLTCLWDKKGLMTGNFDLAGNLRAWGKYGELARSLRGNLEFFANHGRIYRFGILAKIFALLNVSEILMGRLPDLVKEGFAYDSIKAKGTLYDGKLTVKEGIINGPSMKIVWQGDIDWINKKMDLTVLVAPLKTPDRIIEKIPWVGEILGGTLISIPIKVTGDITDPTVIPLSPSAVGSEILRIMKRILRLPFKIIPLSPE